MNSVTPAGSQGRQPRSLARRGRGAWIAFGVYALLAFLYFGLRPLLASGRQYIGVFDDPQIPIWSFAWWLHAIEHLQDPLVTHLVWAPSGVELVWANTVPAISIVFAPLTALVGPVASYDVAAVLLPALSAFTAFLLCRHLTGRFWPSLVGGYLFGFSSYELGHVLGQPQLTAVFVVPLIALVCVRALEGVSGGRRFVVELGLLLGLQFYLATEIALTLTMMLALAFALGFALVPARRSALVALLRPIVGAYLLAAVLAAPLIYQALTNLRVAGFQPPAEYTTDLLNLVIPTHLEAAGAGWAERFARHFPGNSTEQGALIGLPLLAIIALYARSSWRTARGRFLLCALALAVYLSLGPELTVDGHGVVPLPTPLGHQTISLAGHTKFLPLLDNVLPVRLSMYAALACSVIAALWLASARPGVLRYLLPALAVLLLVPNPGAGVWTTTFSVPPFFTSAAYRTCLKPGEIVLPEPLGMGGQADLWQVENGFHYRLAGGRLQTSPPSRFLHPGSLEQISVGYPPVPDQAALLRNYFRVEGVTSVIVDKRQAAIWTPALNAIARPLDVGGVILYRVNGAAAGPCGPG